MATVKSAIVTALDTSIQGKHLYRGNVQSISIYTDNGASGINSGDTVVFSKPLPANCRVLGVQIKTAGVGTGSTLTFSVGGTAVTAALAVGGALDGFYGFSIAGTDGVDGSGKTITGAVGTADWDDGANDLFGHILIVTDE